MPGMAPAASIPNPDTFDVLLLDIEGTVCPVSFVHEVLFPYALDALPRYLDRHWDSPGFAHYRHAFPPDCRHDRAAFEAHVSHLIAQDVKASYLKALQGLLWHDGYHSGHIKAPLFPDVAPFMSAVHAAGKSISIYSSGSVAAQKLLFAHTTSTPSDLTHLITDWFDTVNAGPKRETYSYVAILATRPGIPPPRWLFLSDSTHEVSAAMAAGMHSLPVMRPGNAKLPPDNPLSPYAVSNFALPSSGPLK